MNVSWTQKLYSVWERVENGNKQVDIKTLVYDDRGSEDDILMSIIDMLVNVFQDV